jgi:hypothetical protein
MVNKSGSQPDIQFCPTCKGNLRNVPRSEMESHGYIRKDNSASELTHMNAWDVKKDLRLTKINNFVLIIHRATSHDAQLNIMASGFAFQFAKLIIPYL